MYYPIPSFLYIFPFFLSLMRPPTQICPTPLLNSTWNFSGTKANMKPIDGIHINQPTTNASGTSFRNRVVTLENKSLLLHLSRKPYHTWTVGATRKEPRIVNRMVRIQLKGWFFQRRRCLLPHYYHCYCCWSNLRDLLRISNG